MKITRKIEKGMQNFLTALAIFVSIMAVPLVGASEDPAPVIEKTVNSLIEEFTANRVRLEGNNKELFDLVDRVASPLFDFDYISKLVLAKSWKQATETQRNEFAVEFKKLLIVTYATALFQYTGKETMEFRDSIVKERQGTKIGTVNTEVNIDNGEPIPVVYFLIQDKNLQWKVYNLKVGTLDLVLNYRNVIQSTVYSEGLEGMIADMKANNDKNY